MNDFSLTPSTAFCNFEKSYYHCKSRLNDLTHSFVSLFLWLHCFGWSILQPSIILRRVIINPAVVWITEFIHSHFQLIYKLYQVFHSVWIAATERVVFKYFGVVSVNTGRQKNGGQMLGVKMTHLRISKK